MSDTTITQKPRLKTSAMIASIAGEGQVTRSAPFGSAMRRQSTTGSIGWCAGHPAVLVWTHPWTAA